MDDFRDELDKAADTLKVRQIPNVFAQIKGACELFFGVGLHMADHPINGLDFELRKIHALIIKAEARHAEWLVATYKGKPQEVPQELQQAFMQAMAKLNPGAPALDKPAEPEEGKVGDTAEPVPEVPD